MQNQNVPSYKDRGRTFDYDDDDYYYYYDDDAGFVIDCMCWPSAPDNVELA